VREFLPDAHHILQENLPPFAICATNRRISFHILRRKFCYLNATHRMPSLPYLMQGLPACSWTRHSFGGGRKTKTRSAVFKARSLEDLHPDKTHQILHEAIMLD
jgi:hypothetical protein